MKRFGFLSRVMKSLALAVLFASPINHADADRILYDSFEVVDSSGDPVSWQSEGHPSYLGSANENGSNWSTPYGERGMSTYSSGIGTRIVTYLPAASGNYIVKFNLSSSAAKGEYRAELWADPFFGSPVLVGSATGDTDGSKNMSFSGQITWRYDYVAGSMMDGAELQLKLMQDPNRSDWRNTPIWDNVSVDWVPDVDSSGPTLDDMLDDKNGGTVAPNSLVTYTVTFSEAMNASTVDVSDFGNASAATVVVESVTSTTDATKFLVAVRPTEEGLLRLEIDESAILEDLAGNELDVFISDTQDNVTITVDGTNPILLPSDIVDNKSGNPVKPGTPVTYTLTFSKDMDHTTFTSGDFVNAGDAPISFGTITEISPGVFTIQMTPTGPGTLRFAVASTAYLLDTDAPANELDTDPQIIDDTTIVVDGVAPTLFPEDITDDAEGSPVTAGTLVTYELFFSEDMDASTVDASDFGNAVTVGNAPFTINSVEEASPGVIRIGLTPTGAGVIQLQVNAGAVLKDAPGNALVTTSAIIDDSSVTVEAGDPYSTWSGGAAFNTDTNGDGVKNGLAWLLGATGPSANAISKLPAASQNAGNLVLTFTCLKVANRGGAVLKLQYSKDLGISDAWTSHEVVVPDTPGLVGGVNFTIPSTNPDPNLVNIQATIPASAASPGTRLFARLSGVSAP